MQPCYLELPHYSGPGFLLPWRGPWAAGGGVRQEWFRRLAWESVCRPFLCCIQNLISAPLPEHGRNGKRGRVCNAGKALPCRRSPLHPRGDSWHSIKAVCTWKVHLQRPDESGCLQWVPGVHKPLLDSGAGAGTTLVKTASSVDVRTNPSQHCMRATSAGPAPAGELSHPRSPQGLGRPAVGLLPSDRMVIHPLPAA